MIDRTQSQVIDLLRFPMTVFVVLIHTPKTLPYYLSIDESTFPLFSSISIRNIIEVFFKLTVPHIAVPVFFLISGFLFFQKLEVWDWGIYRKKLISRSKTLLLPYLCWITLSYLCIGGIPALGVLLDGGTWNEMCKTFVEHSYSLVDCYFGKTYTKQYPDWFGYHVYMILPAIAPALWFVRDLMILTILSPLFYFFLQKTKIYGLLLMGVFYISNHSYDLTSALYFCMGAFVAIKNKSIVTVAKQIKIPALTIAIISLFVSVYYAGEITLYGFRIYPIYVLSGVWAAVYISSYLVEKKHIKPNRFLVQSCFFVYALHFLSFSENLKGSSLITYSSKIITEQLKEIPHLELLQFFLPPIVTISICLLLFWLLRKYTPRMCALLTGNRE